MTVRRVLSITGISLVLFAAAVLIYAIWVGATAEALIASARGIHSTVDAERQVAKWKGRSGREFWEETSPNGEERIYDIHVENGLLHRLRLVPPTMVGMTVVIRNRELHHVIVMMFTGRDPRRTAGVWVQEWFGSSIVGGVHVNDKDRPWKATVDLSAGATESDHLKAFMFSTRCFVLPGGCRSAQEILPSLQENWPRTGPSGEGVRP